MRTFAEFQIMGRVGKIKTVGSTLRVSIAAEYGRKDDRGDFQANAYWNEVTIFNENVIKRVKDNTLPAIWFTLAARFAKQAGKTAQVAPSTA